MFEDIGDACCLNDPDNCICLRTEMIIRIYAAGHEIRDMTQKERIYVIDQVIKYAEGSIQCNDLEQLPDNELAKALLYAWSDYVTSNCM